MLESNVVIEDLGRLCMEGVLFCFVCAYVLCLCMFLFWSCDRPTSSCMFFAGEASQDVKTSVSVYFLSITVRFAPALFFLKESLSVWKDGRL